MKMCFPVILLLLLPIASVTPNPVTPNPNSYDNKHHEKYINERRVQYAKSKGIGNMHEIKFDENLMETGHSMLMNCENKTEDFEILSPLELVYVTFNEDTAKLLHPMQTYFACVHMMLPPSCEMPGAFCLLAPYPNPTKDQTKFGKMGEYCTNGVTETKLCKTLPRVVPTTTTTSKPVTDSSVQKDSENDSSIQRSSWITLALTLSIIMLSFV